MADEIITSGTLEKAKTELRGIYKTKSGSFREITKEEYEAIDKDEREDSDNHINAKRIERGESSIIDIAHYKYMENREVAYRIILKDKDGKEMEDYFVVTPEL